MYCTLQEAYNVPSFDPPPRKKRCSPDAQAKASATVYDPYRQDGLGDFTLYKYGKPKSIEERETIHGNKPLQRRIPYESFRNYNGSMPEADPMVRTTYRGMERDRRQYCDMYGVCSVDQIEGFVDGNTNSQTTTGKEGAGSPNRVGTNNSSCQSSPDFYEVPLSEETKKQFKDAMDVSLNQTTASTAIPEKTLRYDDMANVTGYYDDDLEQYLKNSEASGIPKRFPMNPDAKEDDVLHNPDSSPLQKTIKRFSERSIQQPLKPETTEEKSDMNTQELFRNMERLFQKNTQSSASFGWDLAMFILAGILLIILIDQLFKLGVMLGMRHTLELLEPYMKELKEIK